MALFDDAYNKVAELVRTFDTHKNDYLAPKFQEADVRQLFLDDFWAAFGWIKTSNPREQEIRIEKPEVAESGRRADYAFFLKPNFRDPVFFARRRNLPAIFPTPPIISNSFAMALARGRRLACSRISTSSTSSTAAINRPLIKVTLLRKSRNMPSPIFSIKNNSGSFIGSSRMKRSGMES